MPQAVEHGVGAGGSAQGCMPLRNGPLAGAQGGAAPMAVLTPCEEVASVRIAADGQSPIVQHDQLRFGHRRHALGGPPVTLGTRYVLEPSGQAQRPHRRACAAGFLSPGTRPPGCADAGRAGEQHIALVFHPLACGQLEQEGCSASSRGTVVDLLALGTPADRGLPQAGCEASVTAVGHLPVAQQPQALCEAQVTEIGPVHLLPQGVIQAAQSEGLAFVTRRLVQQGGAP